MKMGKTGIFATTILLAAIPLFAVDGREIMQNAHDVKVPLSTHSAVKMDLIEKNGEVESRMVEEWGKEKNDLKTIVMAFHSPASVKDTRFLQVENKDRDDDKWIYLPALRSTRRIASSEGDKSFMGTDATYDDMSSRDVDKDNHELTGEKTVGSWDCYVVKSTAKNPSDSQYLYRINYVDKRTWVPVLIEMYDKKGGDILKVLNVERLENVKGYWITMSAVMKNLKSGHSTRITITKIEIDKPIDERLFSTNFLNTGRLK